VMCITAERTFIVVITNSFCLGVTLANTAVQGISFLASPRDCRWVRPCNICIWYDIW